MWAPIRWEAAIATAMFDLCDNGLICHALCLG